MKFLQKVKISLTVMLLTIICTCLVEAAGFADFRDYDAAHRHILSAISEFQRARAANNYQMEGHGKRVIELLHAADVELGEAMRAVHRR
jgi:hypothetical protein